MPSISTIDQTVDDLHAALKDYIEATYHIADPILIAQRRRLLDTAGVIRQIPYLESTPRYQPGDRLANLGLPQAAKEILTLLTQEPRLVHDPPYQHQGRALEEVLNRGRSLIVITGTGSGKTETFLLPALGKLAREAEEKGPGFGQTAAVRVILLYPMNALVNDQVGRLRLMFGDGRVRDQFTRWCGRPVRFARYTSRTLYPGVRTAKRDQVRLKPIRDYYIRLLEEAQGSDADVAAKSSALIEEFQRRGKWPAKPDLQKWYGADGARWKNAEGEFQRCVLGPEDAEVFTRHEALSEPPDVLVTNYSMLEYMLMRPIERPIFDRTRQWLEENPDETLLLVVDEAHLYRGAPGAEVALLIRRLRARLGVEADRIQVICTSASFSDVDRARAFAAELSGKSTDDFTAITGKLDLKTQAQAGDLADAERLADVDLTRFYEATSDTERKSVLMPFLQAHGVAGVDDLAAGLYQALRDFGPLGELINRTMVAAYPLPELCETIFPGSDRDVAMKALTVLVALGSIARPSPEEAGLLPCRVHSFHRGLPGLWVCLDTECSELAPDEQGGVTGKMYDQPREACRCGARVFELFTCRTCGAAYARAYTDDLDAPNFLWSEPGETFHTHSGQVRELQPIDILLAEDPPASGHLEAVDLDPITGRINPQHLGNKSRPVFLRARQPAGPSDQEANLESGRPFIPCGMCGQSAAFGRTTVQDHQTKGDQPFQALVSRQLQVQPPSAQRATAFAPLRGRKVLLFSDSRQVAARLAANIQGYSFRDTLRVLIPAGYQSLVQHNVGSRLSLQDLYCAILIASGELEVRLRPEMLDGENMDAAIVKVSEFLNAAEGAPDARDLLGDIGTESPPRALLEAAVGCVTDTFLSLEALALASLREHPSHTNKIEAFPPLGTFITSPEHKRSLVRAWLRCWQRHGFWLNGMPPAWWNTKITGHKGNFEPINKFLKEATLSRQFQQQWLPKLLPLFTEQQGNVYRLKGKEVSLEIGGDWAYCTSCRTTQRPFPGSSRCVQCGKNTALSINPDVDPAFTARKGYYRNPALAALRTPPQPPMAFIAAEHTAALGAAKPEQVFSDAEEHELLFQDIALESKGGSGAPRAIDVLSCTTTMEVGIDIGSLSGVALRNMPPARANYQQRAGRAGRRGNALATVVAFGSADSHDEHYFRNPSEMIRGRVEDPLLALDNAEIVQRHVLAYLLQRYYQDRLPEIAPEESPQLFEVLGTVKEFLTEDAPLNRADFGRWLGERADTLRQEVAGWIPAELSASDRALILDNFMSSALTDLDGALTDQPPSPTMGPDLQTPEAADAEGSAGEDTDGDTAVEDASPESDDGSAVTATNAAVTNLLDRLLYKGVLPRYAFPTDVANFYVFDGNNSGFRPVFRYAPSQSLSLALSQYAPGREVWIDGKLYLSGAIYSPFSQDRYDAWGHHRWYYECSSCGYAFTREKQDGTRGEQLDCAACGSSGAVGPARAWLRPPGFAHPVDREPGTAGNDVPELSYATRAKLTAPTPNTQWFNITPRVRFSTVRERLLVTNRGPREMGYYYCARCGRIESAAQKNPLTLAAHQKPFPDNRHAACEGGATAYSIVLGTDFYTDILLLSIQVAPPAILRPDVLATKVALRTICEALVKASTDELGLEPGELEADFRPALTQAGRQGTEVEIYLYDTLAGGAGFSRRVGDRGLSVIERALRLLEECPGSCDSSCYRCLRSFRNRLEHASLDRFLGASLLRHLRDGSPLELPPARLQESYTRLAEDLRRNALGGLIVESPGSVDVAGLGLRNVPILVTGPSGVKTVIDLHHPLTPGVAGDPGVRDIAEFSVTPTILCDEIEIRRSLPQASARILDRCR